MSPIELIALWGLAIFMVGIGVLHFVRPKPFVRIIPKFLPAPLGLVYISGFFEIVGDDGKFAGVAVDAVDQVGADLANRLIAFVFRLDPVGRIGEPDAAVAFDDDVVGRVQLLAGKAVCKNFDGSVSFRARDPSVASFTGN